MPKALLVLAGGVWADRADARRIVLGATAARIVVLLVGAAAYDRTSAHFAVLACVAVAFGVADGIYSPAAATLPRRMVRTEDLGPVAGMFQTAQRLARLAGAPLGGALVAAFGMRATMLVDAATFVVIGAVMYAAVRPRLPRPPRSGATWARDLTSGLAYVRRSVTVRTLVLALSGLNLFVSPALSVGLALRASGGHWGAATLGVLEAGVGLGAAAGALTATRWRPVRPAITGLLVLVVQGAAIVLLGRRAALGRGGRGPGGGRDRGPGVGVPVGRLPGARRAGVPRSHVGAHLARRRRPDARRDGRLRCAGGTHVGGRCLPGRGGGDGVALCVVGRPAVAAAAGAGVTACARRSGQSAVNESWSSSNPSADCAKDPALSAASASRTTRMASPPS